jgi:hypothetical protein
VILRTTLLLLFLLAGAGCADSVSPTFDADKPYTLYGMLDPTTEQQALRVVPFAPDLSPQEPGPLGAVVTSTDLATGESVTWRDSLVTFSNGRTGHVYLADLRPVYGRTYRVVAERADGATSRAVVTIPPFVEPLIQPPVISLNTAVLSVLWPAAPRVNGAEVVFRLGVPGRGSVTEVVPTSLPSDPFEFGWEVRTDFFEDAQQVFNILGTADDVTLLDLRLRAVVSSEDWVPEGGTYDPEVLVDPNALTNVDDGFGFVGGGYVMEVPVLLSEEVIRRGGLQPPSTYAGN